MKRDDIQDIYRRLSLESQEQRKRLISLGDTPSPQGGQDTQRSKRTVIDNNTVEVKLNA